MGYADIILADSPYAYYRLGESSGTTADNAEGTSARDGTYVNTPTLAETGALQGDADTAITLASASSEYVTCPITALGGLIISNDAFSFECWVKTTTTSAMRLFGSASATAFIFFRINQTSAGVIGFGIRNDTGSKSLLANTTVAVGLQDGVWHHIAVTAVPSTNTVVIYFDGVARGVTHTSTQTPDSLTLSHNITIGAINNSGTPADFLNGTIDEVAFYNSILTAAQVREHYAAGLGIFGGGAPQLTGGAFSGGISQ